MEKKIGILTFVKVGNYGAELQAFALCSLLKLIGYNTQIINFSIKSADNKGYESLYNQNVKDIRANINSCINIIISRLMKFIYYNRYLTRKNKFENFYKQYLTLTDDEYTSFSELCSKPLNFSHVIVGSDQVWNYTMKFSVLPFLLYFLKKEQIKISYAASFGVSSIPSYLEEIYKKYLIHFKNISVREKSGASIIAKITGITPQVVLDPTLLLSAQKWRELLNISKNTEKYILIYMLTYSKELLEFANLLSKSTGLPIKQVLPSFFTYKNINRKYSILYDVDPKEFVELISNSTYVLTTSFHGTAFAINFHKPFYTFINSSRNNNSRMYDLLDKLNLTERLVINSTRPNINDFLPIDYNKVEIQLDQLRKDSINYIQTSLQ